jgi:hypothetical protein
VSIEKMNKKHLIQLEATVGAVLVLYVLSYPPVVKWSFARQAPVHDVIDAFTPEVLFLLRFYEPVTWLYENCPPFKFVYRPYKAWWLRTQ